MNVRCMETEYHMLNDISESADKIAKDKAFDELEETLLNNQLCVSGSCGE